MKSSFLLNSSIMPQQFNKKKISQHFSISAPKYDSASVVQRGAADELLGLAKVINPAPARIIDIGCGTGYASRELKAVFPDSYIILMDLAQGMLNQARESAGKENSFIGLRSDAEFLPIKNFSIDLVYTNATLQLCNQVEETVEGIQRVLKPGGIFLGTTFGPATLKEVYQAWEIVDPDNIDGHRFNFHPSSYWQDILNRGKWQTHALEVKKQTQFYPSAMVALNSIRMAGVKNSLSAGKKSLTGRKIFSQFVDELEKLKEPEGIPLTYEIILFKARKLN